jgi:hypothetical protein
MARADAVLFIGNWVKTRKERCEHFIAEQYGLSRVYYEDGTEEELKG